MKVLRQQEVSIQTTGEFKVGDQIQIGKYTATCQKVTRKGALFLLDQYLDEAYKMNRENTNEGGYEGSDLRKELQKNSVLEIFDSVREMMVPFKNGDVFRMQRNSSEMSIPMNRAERNSGRLWKTARIESPSGKEKLMSGAGCRTS